jgi:hypothetical protein
MHVSNWCASTVHELVLNCTYPRAWQCQGLPTVRGCRIRERDAVDSCSSDAVKLVDPGSRIVYITRPDVWCIRFFCHIQADLPQRDRDSGDTVFSKPEQRWTCGFWLC